VLCEAPSSPLLQPRAYWEASWRQDPGTHRTSLCSASARCCCHLGLQWQRQLAAACVLAPPAAVPLSAVALLQLGASEAARTSAWRSPAACPPAACFFNAETWNEVKPHDSGLESESSGNPGASCRTRYGALYSSSRLTRIPQPLIALLATGEVLPASPGATCGLIKAWQLSAQVPQRCQVLESSSCRQHESVAACLRHLHARPLTRSRKLFFFCFPPWRRAASRRRRFPTPLQQVHHKQLYGSMALTLWLYGCSAERGCLPLYPSRPRLSLSPAMPL